MLGKDRIKGYKMSDIMRSPKRLNWAITLIVIIVSMGVTQAWGNTKSIAQNTDPSFEPSPLEINTPIDDPLIPKGNRSLSPLEKRRLREALDQLNIEAQTKFDATDEEGAFQLWYRELILRRFLGPQEEAQALGRVGEKAWYKNRTRDVKNITARLVLLQKETEAKGPLSPELLQTFAIAYQQLRKIDESLYIQQQILANAKAQGDQLAEVKALNAIGELHLSRFDYGKAAPIYEDLLARSQAQKDTYNEGIYLQKLAEIYKELLQPEHAVKIKEQLAENYLQNQQVASIPDLRILIGEDYEALKQLEKASQNYQEAYSLGIALEQFGVAGKALTKLANLYQSQGQDEYALKIYQALLAVEQQSYNYYGLMNAYDKIGDLYSKYKNYPQALNAYNNGLELAKAISYNEEYFLKKLYQVNQQMHPPEPEPEPTPPIVP